MVNMTKILPGIPTKKMVQYNATMKPLNAFTSNGSTVLACIVVFANDEIEDTVFSGRCSLSIILLIEVANRGAVAELFGKSIGN